MYLVLLCYEYGRPAWHDASGLVRLILELPSKGGSSILNAALIALPAYATMTQSWLYAVFGTNSLIYVGPGNTSVTWSISTEWFFYLSFPLVTLIVSALRSKRATGWAICVFCAVWAYLTFRVFSSMEGITRWAVAIFGPVAGYTQGHQDSFIRWLLYFSPYSRIGEFILGVLTARLYLLVSDREPSRIEALIGGAVQAVALVSVPAIVFLMYYPAAGADFLRTLNFSFGLAPSAAAVIFCSARYASIWSRALASRSMLAMGDASYSIYLLHLAVIDWVLAYGKGYGAAVPATFVNTAAALFWFCVAICATISLSLLTCRMIEQPARNWLRSLQFSERETVR